MIRINFIKSPSENYSGHREFHLNNITMGDNGDIVILKEDCSLPLSLMTVQDDKLVCKSDEDTQLEFHINGKLSRLPFALKEGDEVEFDRFKLGIEKVEAENVLDYNEFLDQQYDVALKDPKLSKIASDLSKLFE